MTDNQKDPKSSKTFWLSKALFIDVYQDSLLGRKAATELKFIAITLVIVFIFEFAAWSLLFNTILQYGDLIISYKTYIACSVALMFAIIIFIYERQFVTADLTQVNVKSISAIFIRIIIIFFAAIITAQPIEIFLFQNPITKRIHQESIRLEIIERENEHLKLDSNQKSKIDNLKEQLNQINSKINKNSINQSRKIESAIKTKNNRIQTKANEIKKLEENILQITRESLFNNNTNPPIDSQKASIRTLRNEIKALETDIFKLNDSRLSDNDIKNQIIKNRLESKIRKETQSQLEKVTSREKKLTQWIEDLKQRNNRAILMNGHTSEVNPDWQYSLIQYNFFDKLRILEDLRYGKKPRWPGLVQHQHHELVSAPFSTPNQNEVTQVSNVLEHSNKDTQSNEDTQDNPANQEQSDQHNTSLTEHNNNEPNSSSSSAKEDLITYYEQKYNLSISEEELAQEARIYQITWLIIYGIALIIPMMVIAIKFLMSPELKQYYSYKYQAAGREMDAMTFVTAREAAKEIP